MKRHPTDVLTSTTAFLGETAARMLDSVQYRQKGIRICSQSARDRSQPRLDLQGICSEFFNPVAMNEYPDYGGNLDDVIMYLECEKNL